MYPGTRSGRRLQGLPSLTSEYVDSRGSTSPRFMSASPFLRLCPLTCVRLQSRILLDPDLTKWVGARFATDFFTILFVRLPLFATSIQFYVFLEFFQDQQPLLVELLLNFYFLGFRLCGGLRRSLRQVDAQLHLGSSVAIGNCHFTARSQLRRPTRNQKGGVREFLRGGVGEWRSHDCGCGKLSCGLGRDCGILPDGCQF